uniref:Uncharacterized protein n=1 Tax=Hyaloperonospora arabidopsidis (strain Emoy2) TaxID=559515 RepID=M4BW08_HYAAE
MSNRNILKCLRNILPFNYYSPSLNTLSAHGGDRVYADTIVSKYIYAKCSMISSRSILRPIPTCAGWPHSARDGATVDTLKHFHCH